MEGPIKGEAEEVVAKGEIKTIMAKAGLLVETKMRTPAKADAWTTTQGT